MMVFNGFVKKDGIENIEKTFTFKRWTNYGKDRIYIDIAGKEKGYIDLNSEDNALVVNSNYEIVNKWFEIARDWFFNNYVVR